MSKVKIKNLLIITVLSVILNLCFNTSVYATTMDDVISQGESFLAARNTDEVIDEQALADTSETIYNILFTIAVVLAIAIGMIIGIQFIMGSVEEQAKVKETLVPYVIGVFVVFAAFTIWKIAIELGNDFSPTPAATGGGTSTSTTYTKDAAGNLYCDSCSDILSTIEQRRAHCSNCNKDIKGI